MRKISSRRTLGLSCCVMALAACQPRVVGTELDVDQMLSLFPEGVVGAFDSVKFNQRTGANTLTNLRITAAENPDTGVLVQELIIWGARPEMLEARLGGKNLEGGGRLLEKLEARDIRLFGVEAFYDDFNDAYLGVVEDFAEDILDGDLSDEFDDALDQSFTTIDKLSLGIDKITLKSIDLRPYERAIKQQILPDSGDVESADLNTLLEYMKDLAALYRSFSAEEISFEGMNYDFVMGSDVQDMAMQMALPSMKIENLVGGDIERISSGNIRFSATATINPEAVDAEFDLPNIDMTGQFGSYVIEGLELDKAYRYLAMGEMPPRSDTDLMSLGTWTLEDMSFSIFGTEFYSLDKSVTDVSGWHWLIPTNITVDVDRLRYNVAGFFENVVALDPDLQADEDLDQFLAILPVLNEYGLAAPVIDLEGRWIWDAENGPAEFGVSYGIEQYGTFAMDLSGRLPEFSAAASAVETSGVDALRNLFEQDVSLTRFSMSTEDTGGIDNILALAIEVAKVLPESDGINISNMSPAGLKGMAVGGLSFASAQAAQVFPPATEYIASLSRYIQDGGTLSVSLEPERGLNSKDFQKLLELGGDPDAVVALLGLEVVHKASAP